MIRLHIYFSLFRAGSYPKVMNHTSSRQEAAVEGVFLQPTHYRRKAKLTKPVHLSSGGEQSISGFVYKSLLSWTMISRVS
jgi:hypothetical protein